MSAPRHLWSDSWRAESAATGAELAAKRRGPAQASEEAPTEAVPARAKPAIWTRFALWARGLKPVRPTPTPTPKPPLARTRPQATSATPRAATASPPATGTTPPAVAASPPAATTRPATSPKPSASSRPRQRRQPDRSKPGRWRVLLPGLLAAMISGALAYAAISWATGSSAAPSASTTAAPAWLGIQMESLPLGAGGFQFGAGSPAGGPVSPFAGVLITAVAPGSPAATAGLEPGDMLTGIAGRQVTSPTTVQSVIAGLHAGDHVEVQFDRGLTNYATQVTLAQRPPGSSP